VVCGECNVASCGTFGWARKPVKEARPWAAETVTDMAAARGVTDVAASCAEGGEPVTRDVISGAGCG